MFLGILNIHKILFILKILVSTEDWKEFKITKYLYKKKSMNIDNFMY